MNKLEIQLLHGQYYGLLSNEERAAVDTAIKQGLAKRIWTGTGGLLGLSKVVILSMLAGCTTYVPVEPARHPISYGLYYPHDPAAHVVSTCDQLRLTEPDAHRLCVMRGIDRLRVKPEPLPQGTCSQGIPCGASAPIPLAPQAPNTSSIIIK